MHGPALREETLTLVLMALGDALLQRGWFHDRQKPPDQLHSTVSNSNTGVIERYLKELAECVDGIAGNDDEDGEVRKTARSVSALLLKKSRTR